MPTAKPDPDDILAIEARAWRRAGCQEADYPLARKLIREAGVVQGTLTARLRRSGYHR